MQTTTCATLQDPCRSGTIVGVSTPEAHTGEWSPDDNYAGPDPDDLAAEPDGAGLDVGIGREEPRPPAVAPVRRLVSLGVVGLTALLTVAVVVGVQFAHGSFALVVLGIQILFVVVWTVAGQPPAPRVVGFVGLVVAVGADLAAVFVRPASLAPMAYITAGGFVVAVIGQLLRPAGRVRVTESLGSSLMVVLGVVAYATLVVLSRIPTGTQVISACAVGVVKAQRQLAISLAHARLLYLVRPDGALCSQAHAGSVNLTRVTSERPIP
jgi:hypothetical protein